MTQPACAITYYIFKSKKHKNEIDTDLVLGCFSKTELTELGKLRKTTHFYLENLVNSEKPISFARFCSVLLGFARFYLVLLGFTWFYSEKLISTEQCSWLSEKTSDLDKKVTRCHLLSSGFCWDNTAPVAKSELSASTR